VRRGAIFASSRAAEHRRPQARRRESLRRNPHYGRVDEAFVTADVLSEDQIRILYAARIVHGLTAAPRSANLTVNRKRKGAALAAADFTTTPVRLHNFTAGALTDEGSGGVALTNNGPTLSVAGADGSVSGGFSFAGAQSGSARPTRGYRPRSPHAPTDAGSRRRRRRASGISAWGTPQRRSANIVSRDGSLLLSGPTNRRPVRRRRAMAFT
jgi:hypothetical protein